MNELHKPVLLEETIDRMNIRPDGIYVDMTLGRGGHSEEIAKRLTGGKLISFDRDEEAILTASDRLKPYGDRVVLVRSDFREIKRQLELLGIGKVDGILMDLGVSSPQLDDSERGFSYMNDAPLDMRMDRDESLSAYNIVNEWDLEEVKRILTEYGEERYAGRIAQAIVQNRPVETTLQLVDIIKTAMPAKALREKQHPAKRSFQAIRIAVNDELGALAEALEASVDLLKEGGRIAVITFHSLEDRIVKVFFKEASTGCVCPPSFPVCICNRSPEIRIITRKPTIATDREVEENPRARSAKLRVAERV